MFQNTFIEVMNMSFIGSIVILAVFIIRQLMKKMPKKYSYLLWIIPLIRLIIPFSIESIMSLIPVNPEPIPQNIGYDKVPVIKTGIQVVDSSVNQVLPVGEVVASVNPIQVMLSIGSAIWIVGMIVFIIYGIFSYTKVNRSLADAKTRDGKIYYSGTVSTAFVLGIVNPKIFLPSSIQDAERDYILCHEQTHISKYDHIFRFVSYLVLGVHWFNPIVWLAFYLSGKDMEMACDESVIEQLGREVKTDYSQSLLSFTTKNYKLNVSPLAFGEGNTKDRIKNVLRYKKPRQYMTIIGVMILLVALVVLLSNPISEKNNLTILNQEFSFEEIYQYKTEYVGDNSNVSHIANELPELRSDLTQKYISINSDTVNQLTIYYEATSRTGFDDEIVTDSVLKHNMEKNGLIIFALVENLDEITFAVRKTPSTKLDVDEYTSFITYRREVFDEKYGDMSTIGNEIDLLEQAYRGLVETEGLKIFIWNDIEISGTDETYYTLISGHDNVGLYDVVYDLNSATTDFVGIKSDVYDYKIGTVIDLNFVNPMPLEKIDSIAKVIEAVFTEYEVNVIVREPIEKLNNEQINIKLSQTYSASFNEVVYLSPFSSSTLDYYTDGMVGTMVNVTNDLFQITNEEGTNFQLINPIYRLDDISVLEDKAIGMSMKTDNAKLQLFVQVMDKNGGTGYYLALYEDELWLVMVSGDQKVVMSILEMTY